MKRKLLLVAALGAVLTGVGSVVFLHHATFTQATPTTMPVQPFAPAIATKLVSSALGGGPGLIYNVDVPQGTRLALATVVYGAGFPVVPDEDVPDGTLTGSVEATTDTLCDGEVDLWVQNDPPNYSPYPFYERTTDVDTDGLLGTDPEDYVLFNSPPWEMISRQRADILGLHEGGAGGPWWPAANPIPVNSIIMQVPWQPGTTADQVTVGGDPAPPNGMCTDSPQNSVSTETGITLNPPARGDSNTDGIDDGTGLYIRWTTFTSNPDIRKSITAATLPPTGSPGDTAYVERMVIPECFWIDADGSPDLDLDGYISAAETQADPDIPGTGYGDIDSDGDCLIDPAWAQPGQPVDSQDEPTGTLCPALVYSDSGGAIQVQYDTAADQDCDGLTDGIEVAWGSDPTLADSDGDGASDFLEMFEFTNPNDPDTDGDGIKDKPEDDYVAAAAAAAETGEVANADDNCPNRYNPGQENNDGQRIANGAAIPGDFASNPNADTAGDACDQDNDNDGISDVAELNYATMVPTPPGGGATCTLDPMDRDTDGDHTLDGIEHQIGSNPCVYGPVPYGLTADQTRLFRGGGISVPPNGLYGGVWDAENDMDDDGREMNADADYTGTPPSANNSFNSKGDGATDWDNDDGPGNWSWATEMPDFMEVRGFNTGPSRVDSDGDGCADWIEMVDVNGDRQSNILDAVQFAQSCLGGEATVEPDSTLLDINQDKQLNILDVMVAAKQSNMVKAHGVCPSDTER
jgi:hypothetical protein